MEEITIYVDRQRHEVPVTEAAAFIRSYDLKNTCITLASPNSKELQRVLMYPDRRKSAPMPYSAFEYVKAAIKQRHLHVTAADAARMLRYGRSSVIPGRNFRLSIRPDIYGRVSLITHSRSSREDLPVDMAELCEKGHLGHTVKYPDPVNGIVTDCFVSYDPELHVAVSLPCYRMYFPMSLHGCRISYRQRHNLSKGRRITLSDGTCAQVDALSASVVFTKNT